VSLRDGPQKKRRRESLFSTALRRGVLETEIRDRLFVVYSSDSKQKLKTAGAGDG
jgi:hypothetical protein